MSTAPARRIHVKDAGLFAARGIQVPWQALRHAPFKFDPQTFAIGSEYLKHHFINADVQTNSLDGFLADPTAPCLYAVGSEPTGEKAAYFAAYLVAAYLKAQPHSRVVWLPLWDRQQEMIKNQQECSLLVISDVYPDMPVYRMEKLRDLVSAYANIPIIMVVSGTDPVTFCYTQLRIKNTHLFYSAASIVKRKVEVV